MIVFLVSVLAVAVTDGNPTSLQAERSCIFSKAKQMSNLEHLLGLQHIPVDFRMKHMRICTVSVEGFLPSGRKQKQFFCHMNSTKQNDFPICHLNTNDTAIVFRLACKVGKIMYFIFIPHLNEHFTRTRLLCFLLLKVEEAHWLKECPFFIIVALVHAGFIFHMHA